MLWDAQTEVAEAKALKNLRLHERQLRRQLEKDKAELNQLRKERFEAERQQRQAELTRQQEKRAQQRRQEQARQRAERRKARETVAQNANGFEFSNKTESADCVPMVKSTGDGRSKSEGRGAI